MPVFKSATPPESETDSETVSSDHDERLSNQDTLEHKEDDNEDLVFHADIDGCGQQTPGTLVPFFERLNETASLPLQRISFALGKLKHYGAKTILELGCGDLSNGIKYLRMFKQLRSITGVDIDIFELAKGMAFALEGTTWPPRIRIFEGDATEPCKEWLPPPSSDNKPPDAVLCIEVLEHLESKPLNDLPEAVFGMLQPDVAIFTTPNKDYNIVLRRIFGQLTFEDKFRHWDHKFEWSREEFREWCNKVVKQYPEYCYLLEDTGVVLGTLPDEILDHGRCSSVATFERDSTKPLRHVDWTGNKANLFL